jgi:hypothetical protein
MGFEGFMRGQAQLACGALARDLRERVRLGLYLHENPDVFRELARPLLLRLLDGPTRGYFDACLSLAACDALLAAGDRSEKMLRLLEEVLQRPMIRESSGSHPDVRFRWVHGLEKQEAIRLNELYQLSLPVSEAHMAEADTQPKEPQTPSDTMSTDGEGAQQDVRPEGNGVPIPSDTPSAGSAS